MSTRLSIILISAALLGAVSCRPSDQDAAKFLGWSMDKYKNLGTFSAKCDWRLNGDGKTSPAGSAVRTIVYQAPNLFSVKADMAGGLVTSSVSDGAKLVDFTNLPDTPGQAYAAPPTIEDAESMQMQHGFFCGSLLYKFFGGSGRLIDLVDESKAPVTMGDETTLANGDKARTVKFYATGPYGHTSVVIDEKTGMVQSIAYDSEPLVQQLKAQNVPTDGLGDTPTTEQYTDIQMNPSLPKDAFKVILPPGKKIQDLTFEDQSKPPVAIGKPAPNFTITSIDGKQVKLSDFRGKPVFLDFWATWCEPCRKSLPHTQKLASDHGNEIAVLAITTDKSDVVDKFKKENKYTYPTYLDPDGKVSQLYNADGLPTFVLIDAKGNLVDYETGYASDEPLNAALAKVGVKA